MRYNGPRRALGQRRRYMPDATRSQHPKPRNAVRTWCVVREGHCRKKGSFWRQQYQIFV
jgi:hypothetical protein